MNDDQNKAQHSDRFMMQPEDVRFLNEDEVNTLLPVGEAIAAQLKNVEQQLQRTHTADVKRDATADPFYVPPQQNNGGNLHQSN